MEERYLQHENVSTPDRFQQLDVDLRVRKFSDFHIHQRHLQYTGNLGAMRCEVCPVHACVQKAGNVPPPDHPGASTARSATSRSNCSISGPRCTRPTQPILCKLSADSIYGERLLADHNCSTRQKKIGLGEVGRGYLRRKLRMCCSSYETRGMPPPCRAGIK